MPEADDAPARDDGEAGFETDEVAVPAEGVAVPEHGLEVPDADVLSVPDAGVTVPDAGVESPEVTLEPPEVTLEPPEVTLEPPEVSMPPLPETGESRVDAAVRPLADLGVQPTEEHVGAYEAAHTGLQDVLADLDRDTDGHT